MKKILLIEDNEMNIKLMRDILVLNGFEVEVCSDGRSGLKRLCENVDRIDLVLLDIQLPLISGIEILEKLEDLGISKKIVIVSACAMESDINATKKFSNVIDYITKPINIKDFISRIKVYL